MMLQKQQTSIRGVLRTPLDLAILI